MGDKAGLLVAIAEDAEAGVYVPLTFSCKGTIISGLVVSHALFNRTLGGQFVATGDATTSEYGEVFTEPMPETDELQPEPRSLFLIGACAWSGNVQHPSNSRGCWKCRIESIDALSFGSQLTSDEINLLVHPEES